MVPAMMGQLTTDIKDTSLVGTIGVFEPLRQGRTIYTQFFNPIEATPATAGPPSLGVWLAAPAGVVMTTGMYFITIIADDGRVVASTKAREPSAADGFFLPRVSASRTGVYYLEGATEIRLLR